MIVFLEDNESAYFGLLMQLFNLVLDGSRPLVHRKYSTKLTCADVIAKSEVCLRGEVGEGQSPDRLSEQYLELGIKYRCVHERFA
ncbi:hypothetical protein M7I_5439 [Glarea lozoyensis 74030]|uniref:Uncharacterized protein n=1 Tax=Glarea lozoyensis (strain ATCC 74030 / MF5533) TaxID=1104152 RepID=H0ERW7_GLAL7|nr:hypothetical protein M7I_5439 [Glarea lozoyensis 74030]